MARYRGPVCRRCRREREKLFLKGERCHTSKCAIENRNYPPGERTFGYRRQSEYGRQLREKQKMKRAYGLLEAQFRNLFEEAEHLRGITGEQLLQLLELRLDNVVYRLGLAGSRRQARQFIDHGHILVNGERVDIPSYRVQPGDVVEITESMEENTEVQKYTTLARQRGVKEWLNLEDDPRGKVVREPARDEIDDVDFDEHLVVELYSK
ncbi:MAG: 30S ribosomal protein S4 [bacterium]